MTVLALEFLKKSMQVIDPPALTVIVPYAFLAITCTQHLSYVERISRSFRLDNEGQRSDVLWRTTQRVTNISPDLVFGQGL